jgi:hypothetical protein
MKFFVAKRGENCKQENSKKEDKDGMGKHSYNHLWAEN